MAAAPRISAGDWRYETVFLALIKQGYRLADLSNDDIYVELYPQSPNCAILYSPLSKRYAKRPLHLKRTRVESWKEEVFKRIKPFIDDLGPDSKPDSNEFYRHHVVDWNGFATALKLEFS